MNAAIIVSAPCDRVGIFSPPSGDGKCDGDRDCDRGTKLEEERKFCWLVSD